MFKDYLIENTDLFENALLQADKRARRFEKLKDEMGKKEAESEVEAIVYGYQDAINAALKAFKSLLKKATKRYDGVKILTDVKSVSSIIDKVVGRKKSFLGLSDIVRGAVLFDNQEDLDDFTKRFPRKYGNVIQGHKSKTLGSDPTYGYHGSEHFSLDLEGFTVELQAMTKKLWHYKAYAHDIYNATRSKGKVSKEDMYQSKRLFKLGNKPSYVKESELNEWLGWTLVE